MTNDEDVMIKEAAEAVAKAEQKRRGYQWLDGEDEQRLAEAAIRKGIEIGRSL